MSRVLMVLLIVGLTSSVSPGQTEPRPDAKAPPANPLHLQPVFGDDFSEDTRADYTITGDVSWESGKLTLAEGASIERAINGGPWARVELALEHVPVTTEQPTSELRVWFNLQEATPCYVRLRRQLKDGKTVGSVALVDTGEMDGEPTEPVVREVRLEDTALGTVSVEYRNGLVRVAAQDDQWFAAYIDNASATIGSVTLQSVLTAVGFRKISAAALSANERAFTEAEQQALAKASAANGELIALYREGNFAAAAEIGEQVVIIRKLILGEQHPEYATSLNNVAAMYQRMGNNARAEPLYRQALEIKKSVLGEQHPEYATGLNNLAALYQSLGDYAQAEKLFRQALGITKSSLGEQHPDYATSLNNLAALFQRMGDSVQAESLHRQALAIRKSMLGEQHPYYAISLNELGRLHQSMGDYTRAEPLYRQASEIWKSALGEQHPDYATGLNNLASLYKDLGDYPRAEPLYRKASEIWKAGLGEQHPTYASSLYSLASLYAGMGDYARAESLNLQALAIRKSVLGEQHPDYAISLNALARLHISVADYARAEPLLRQALEIKKSVLGEQHPEYAISLSNLAFLNQSMGDYARAESLYLRASEIYRTVLGEQHPDYATSLHNLAGLYQSIGEYARAEPLYKQALEIKKSVLGMQHPGYAATLNNLAGLYQSIDDYAAAEPFYQQALEIRKSVLGEQHPDYAFSLNDLAVLYDITGDYARAEPLFKQSLEIRKLVLGEQHPDYATSLLNLAHLYMSMSDDARAEPHYKQALQVRRASLDANAVVQSARQQDRNQTSQRYYLDDRLANALTLESLSTGPLEDVWQWKGAVTTRQQAYRQVAANPRLAPLFSDLQSVSRQLSALTGQTPVPPAKTATDAPKTAFEQKRKVWNDRFVMLTRQREDLEQQIAAGSEEFRRIRQRLTVAEVMQWLPTGTAFVDFLEYQHATTNAEQNGKPDRERRFIAFVVRPDKEPAMIAIGSSEAMADAITAFRLPFQSSQNTPENRQSASVAANQIRRDLWLPIEAHLDGIDTVIISPDTALGTLPFAALPGKQDGSYLLENYRIAMIPMASQLRKLFERKSNVPANRGLLVLGDIDYDAAPGAPESVAALSPPLLADAGTIRDAGQLRAGHAPQWDSLPGFLKELQAITTLYANQHPDETENVLSGDKASETAFLTQAPQYGTLHLITHGYFEDPSVKSTALVDVKQDLLSSDTKGPDPFINTYLPGLLSGLAMAGANHPSDDPEDPRDGILRSSEIEASSMQGVDLVVLSACETGLGAVAGGEGLTGLQRAFHIAGARSVVASLWKVDDDATLTLMTEFYTNLWEKKMSKLDALWEAQLTMLRGYNPQTGELTRGLGGKSVPLDPNKKAEPATTTIRLDPRYWAAFQLSGDWR